LPTDLEDQDRFWSILLKKPASCLARWGCPTLAQRRRPWAAARLPFPTPLTPWQAGC